MLLGDGRVRGKLRIVAPSERSTSSSLITTAINDLK